MKKRILTTLPLLALAMAPVLLTSCGNEKDTTTEAKKDSTTEATAVDPITAKKLVDDYTQQHGEVFEFEISETGGITLTKYKGKGNSVEIPKFVTSIGYSAFATCNSLSSVTIPNSVTSIGEQAFTGCDSLSSVTIPNSVTSIGDGAFALCTSLSSVTIPNSVTSIGEEAFGNCDNLTSIYVSASSPVKAALVKEYGDKVEVK